MWWPFKRTIEKRIVRSFERDLRLIQVSLFTKLKSSYSLTMEDQSASLVAAQVVNYLKGDDIAAVIENSIEPLKSRIGRIRGQLPEDAAKAMAESGSTREVVVATLRMRLVVNRMLTGESYPLSDEYKRISELLSTYGPEFPEAITLGKYGELSHRWYQEHFGPKA
jgi:hypothetical protein